MPVRLHDSMAPGQLAHRVGISRRTQSYQKEAAGDPTESNGESLKGFSAQAGWVEQLQKETFSRAFQKKVKQEDTAQYFLIKKDINNFFLDKICILIGKEIKRLYSNKHLHLPYGPGDVLVPGAGRQIKHFVSRGLVSNRQLLSTDA